jgi:phage-related protein
MLLPTGYNYPINIQVKCDPRVVNFGNGFQQRSGFESLRSTTLNYLGLRKSQSDSLIATLDGLGGVDPVEWDFRPHYGNKWWLVNGLTNTVHDQGRLEEIAFELKEYPRGLPGVAIPTIPPLLDIAVDRSPVISRQYRNRSPQLGMFFDRRKEIINPIIESVQISSTGDHATADSIDLLLSKCRGVYPLIWEGSTYVCSEWSISYESECAIVGLTLQTNNRTG